MVRGGIKQMATKKRKASPAEVISYWLNYEYRDRREFRKFIDSHFTKDDLRLISEDADHANEKENAKRYEMLSSYRGFIKWFSHAEWWEATLDAKEKKSVC